MLPRPTVCLVPAPLIHPFTSTSFPLTTALTSLHSPPPSPQPLTVPSPRALQLRGSLLGEPCLLPYPSRCLCGFSSKSDLEPRASVPTGVWICEPSEGCCVYSRLPNAKSLPWGRRERRPGIPQH